MVQVCADEPAEPPTSVERELEASRRRAAHLLLGLLDAELGWPSCASPSSSSCTRHAPASCDGPLVWRCVRALRFVCKGDEPTIAAAVSAGAPSRLAWLLCGRTEAREVLLWACRAVKGICWSPLGVTAFIRLREEGREREEEGNAAGSERAATDVWCGLDRLLRVRMGDETFQTAGLAAVFNLASAHGRGRRLIVDEEVWNREASRLS